MTVLRWLHRLEDAVLVLMLLSMILLAGADILGRTLFGGGILWIPPLLRVMVLWVGLLGGLMATRTREHIAIDLVERLANPAVSRYLLVLTSAFSAFVCGVIAWHSHEFVLLAREFNDIAFGDVPAWPLQLIIPFTFGLTALRFAIQSIQALTNRLPETAS